VGKGLYLREAIIEKEATRKHARKGQLDVGLREAVDRPPGSLREEEAEGTYSKTMFFGGPEVDWVATEC